MKDINIKRLSPPKTSSWDLEAFDQQITGDSTWDNSQGSGFSSAKKKKATRVQDLAFSLDTPPESPVPTNIPSSWPFESSPCRLFGGKNTMTKKLEDAEQQSANEQLFDTKFADKTAANGFVSDDNDDQSDDRSEDIDYDEETSIEDDMKSDSMLNDDSEYDSDSFYGDDDSKSTDSAFAQRERSSVSIQNDDPLALNSSPSRKRNTNVAVPSKSPGRASRGAKIASSGNSVVSSSSLQRKRPERKASPQKRTERQQAPPPQQQPQQPMKQELKQDKNRRREKPLRSKSNEDLVAATYHGTAAYAVEPAARPRVRRGVNRAKSSDGMEGMSSSVHTWSRKGRRNDELATSSMHASSASLGRTRSRSSQRRPKAVGALDRRGKLSRAMSNTNVIRPEEYASGQQQSNEPAPERRAPKRASSMVVQTKRQSKAPAEVPSTRAETEEAAAEDSSVMATRPRPSLRRKRSARLGRSGSNRSLNTSSHQQGKPQPQGSEASGSGTSPKAKSNAAVPPSATPVKRSTRERRDLAMLLRERKTIQPADLMDKENRKLLHFLMYEHKMGIPQKDLLHTMRQEQESA